MSFLSHRIRVQMPRLTYTHACTQVYKHPNESNLLFLYIDLINIFCKHFQIYKTWFPLVKEESGLFRFSFSFCFSFSFSFVVFFILSLFAS